MNSLAKILKQNKSDKQVIKEALLSGFNGVQIRNELMKLYPLSYPNHESAYEFYNNVTCSIPLEFFEKIKSNQINKK